MFRSTGFLLLILFALWSCSTTERLQPQPNVWLIKTNAVAKLGGYKASTGGSVSVRGGDQILSRGVCWSNTQTIPTLNLISSNKTDEGPGSDDWISTITGLTPNDSIWVRAYVYSKNGTYYGQLEKYLVPLETKPPTVITNQVVDARRTSAALSGRISTDGGANIVDRGFWLLNTGTQIAQHIGLPVLNPDSIDPNFNMILPGLTTNTTYEVKAYARNKDYPNREYGESKFFFTSSDRPDAFPAVETIKDSIVIGDTTTIYLKGNVILNGDFPVISKGFCISTEQNPSVTDMVILDSFVAFKKILVKFGKDQKELQPGIPYYYRAFGQNQAGIGYGVEKSFVLTP